MEEQYNKVPPRNGDNRAAKSTSTIFFQRVVSGNLSNCHIENVRIVFSDTEQNIFPFFLFFFSFSRKRLIYEEDLWLIISRIKINIPPVFICRLQRRQKKKEIERLNVQRRSFVTAVNFEILGNKLILF